MIDKPDIANRADIERIVSRFYQRLMIDPAIGFFFTDIAKINLDSHLPKVADFWEFQVFGSPVYSSDFYQTHKALNEKTGLLKEHFDWWLHLFCKTVDEHAQGDKATAMKHRARLMATAMADALVRNASELSENEKAVYFHPSWENSLL